MNDLNERDELRLRDMLENARLALRFMQGKTRDDLQADTLLAYSVVRALEVIGEAAYHVTPETRKQLPDIEWAVVQDRLESLVEALLAVLRPRFPDLE
jgi:uncharacterized protein with HEPN domain